MAHLTLSLLGSYHLKLDGQSIDAMISDKGRALLAFLAIENGRSHPREKLAGIFWPEHEETHARGSLSQALYHLRGILDDKAKINLFRDEPETKAYEPYLLVTSQDIQFNHLSDCEIDVVKFQRLVSACKEHVHAQRAVCEECLARYVEAASLYGGEFLDGFYLPRSVAFEEWAMVIREQLHLAIMTALEWLVKAYEQQGELEQALLYARRMVVLDELGEAGIGYVMRLLALHGKRREAMEGCEAFRQVLAIQLGAEPGAEVQQLFKRLRSEEMGEEYGYYPATLTPFVGRKKELSELWGWLQDPSRRLISIHGLGGSGKTRLAMEAGWRQRYYFRDGMYFVPLSAMGPGSSLLATIAERVGFIFRDYGDRKQQLLEYLRHKKLLLILDSFEVVVEAAGLVAEILEASKGSKVLVTSRVRLTLYGEHVFSLVGMHYPQGTMGEEITEYSAVQLFLDAAKRVNPTYQPEDLQAVGRICRLVGGMPLSLLLASSWVNEYTEQEIVEQIERSLDFLSAEWVDLPESQHSLRATYEYSWNLLTELEQQALMGISIFRGPFTAQAALWVASVKPVMLHALVGKSLLWSIPGGQFQMHDLVKQYSYEKLSQGGESRAENTHQKHSDYFLERAAGWRREFKGPGQAAMLLQADKIIEDVRVAWGWAAQQADQEQLWRASEGLFLYYFLRYRFQEGEQACMAAIEGIQDASKSGERLNLEGWLLAWQVYFTRLLGKAEQARQLAENCQQLLSQAEAAGQDTRGGQALLWRERGYLAGNLPEQIDCFQHSAELFQSLGDAWWQALVLTWAGEITNRMGDRILGLKQHQQAVALSRLAGEPRLLARSTMNLAYDHLIHWRWETGAQLMEEAAEWFRSVGDLGSLATGELHLGVSYGWTGRVSEAHEMLEKALAKVRQLGDHFYNAYGTLGLGIIQMYCGRYDRAALTLQEALQIARQYGYLREAASGLSQTGCLALVHGKTEKGLEDLQQSVSSLRQMGFAGELGMALGGLALGQHLIGQQEQALASLEKALRIAVETHSRFTLFNLGAAIIVILADTGKWELTVEAYYALMADPIISSSRWTEDMIGGRMDLAREQLPEDIFQAAEQRGLEGDLFKLLDNLVQDIEAWNLPSLSLSR